MTNLEMLRKKRDQLFEELEAAGGRGVELANEIDEIDARIEVMQTQMDLKEAIRIVLRVLDWQIESHGYPDDEGIADREPLRIALINEAWRILRKHAGPEA